MQGTDAKPEKYKNMEVLARGLKVGERMIIVNDNTDNWHTDKDSLTGMNDSMVKCYREDNHKLHYVGV